MNDFFFIHPERWWFVALPIALAALGVSVFARKKHARARYADLTAHDVLFEDAAPRGRALSFVLEFAGLTLIALAALEPAAGYTVSKVQRRGIDIVVCLDTSRSMLAEDVVPSRLDRAKRDLGALLPHLGGDRIALIAFAGSTHVVCPLTHDLGAFEALLGGVDTTATRSGGTDIGGALRAALALLPADGAGSQTVILLSDGEDLEAKAQSESELMRTRGVRLHAIGYGSPLGAKIPEDDGGYVKDENGQDVVTKLDAEGLRTLATSCSGVYVASDAYPLPVVEVFEKRVQPLAKRRFESEDRREPRNRYQIVLLPGILALIVGVLLQDRTRRRRSIRGSMITGAERSST
ncbi:MAG: VWA domain-containing protein [Planctomycetes bacterium]|nr:VWA domain-containing protein [Planctomycetota bacterium]